MLSRTPTSTNDAVLMVCHLVHRHLAGGTVHHNLAVGDDAHHVVALDRVAARGWFGGVTFVLLV